MFSDPGRLMHDVSAVVTLSLSDALSPLPLESDSVFEGGMDSLSKPVNEPKNELAAVVGQLDLLAVGDIEPQRDRLGESSASAVMSD
jgi:hypothetical protein